MNAVERQIVITTKDMLRLTEIAEKYGYGRTEDAAMALEGELIRATMVGSDVVEGDVVTMNSRVRYIDETTSREREITLSYPDSTGEERVSVLSPVGVALLGLRAGDTIEWGMPDGRNHRLRVIEVLYQPEAAGDFHL